MNQVYHNIKAIRLQKNLSQNDAGKLIGTNQSNFNRIETGQTHLTIERMEQIARAFEMTISELMNYQGSEIVNSEVSEYINTIKLLESKIIKIQEKHKKEDEKGSELFVSITDSHKREVDNLEYRIEDLKDKLKKSNEILKEKDQRIKEKEDRLKEKDERLKDKDLVIETLKMLINSKDS